MNRSCFRCVRLVAFCCLLVTSVLPAVADTGVLSIASARSAVEGTTVTVEGSVTVPSSRFSSSTFDQGFAIQDQTAGIYVSVATDYRLQLHRRVRVTGILGDDGYGQLVLRPETAPDVRLLEGALPVRPQRVDTAGVGESTEGSLVVVKGSIVAGPTNDLPYGYSLFVDDGSGETQIFIPASTGIDPFRMHHLKEGVSIRVTGLSSQFNSNLEVLPRGPGDIQLAR